MYRPSASLAVLLVTATLGCSAGGGNTALSLGNDGTGGNSGNNSGTGGMLNLGGVQATSSLTARIESPPGVTVTVVTLSCANDCADVVAVAEGGFPPYTYLWEDGPVDPARHVCPSATTTFVVSATDNGSTSGEFARDPQTVRAEVTANVIQCPADGGIGIGGAGGGPSGTGGGETGGFIGAGGSIDDAGPPIDRSQCVTGDPRSTNVAYFMNGATLPAGRYRITYLDGCMKYGSAVQWSVHNLLGFNHWDFVGDPGVTLLGVLPGVTGGGFASFDECVAQSLLSPPLQVSFQGGKLGVLVSDYPLDDNVPGENGRNPTWCFTSLS